MKTIVRRFGTKLIESITVNNEYLKDDKCIKVLGNAIYDLTKREIGTNVLIQSLEDKAGCIQSQNFAVTIISDGKATIFNIASVCYEYILINDAKV